MLQPLALHAVSECWVAFATSAKTSGGIIPASKHYGHGMCTSPPTDSAAKGGSSWEGSKVTAQPWGFTAPTMSHVKEPYRTLDCIEYGDP